MSENATQDSNLPATTKKGKKGRVNRRKKVQQKDILDLLPVEIPTPYKDEDGKPVREQLQIPATAQDNKMYAKLVVARTQSMLDEVKEMWLAEVRAGESLGGAGKAMKSPRLNEVKTLIECQKLVMDMGKFAYGEGEPPSRGDLQDRGILAPFIHRVGQVAGAVSSIETKVSFEDALSRVRDAEVVAVNSVSQAAERDAAREEAQDT